MFAASKTATPSGGTSDPQFNYVTMLLHGDGTNGAQNNTFVDSSTNNYTITRTGNTTQGSFSPYGSNWSNYFDGTGDYLTTSNSTAFSLGSSDFTFEAWVNFTAQTDANGDAIFAIADGTSNRPLTIYRDATSFRVDLSTGGSNLTQIQFATTFNVGTWYHVAIVRNSNTIYCYVNGVSIGTPTAYSSTIASYTSTVYVGRIAWNGAADMVGYISNLRLVKGTAVYTSAFTPSTTPLTTITNTSLLTCQSNRFIDNSANNLAITSNGDTSVQRFNPFGTSTAYSTSVIGGSAYFDGSGDNLKFPANSGLLGSNDFSFEAWVYPITLSSIAVVSMGQSDLGTATGSSYGFYVSPSGDTSDLFVGGTTYSATSPNPKIGAWNHVAYVRTGSTFSTYLNGVRVGTTSVSGSLNNGDTTYPATLGGFSNGPVGRPFNGYIAGYQRIIGSGGYNATSTTITVPTTPPTAVTNTNALLNFTNGAIFDNAMMSDLETVGNAQISTSVVKYGTGSLKFNGTTDYLTLPSSSANQMGSGPFTIEAWIYPTTISGTQTIVGKYVGGSIANSEYWLFVNSSGKLAFVVDGNGAEDYIESSAGAISANTWTYVVGQKTASSISVWVNGTLAGVVGSSVTSTSVNTTPLNIGSYNNGLGLFTGYIDELRITKGVARYSGSSFTPPTAAFSNTGPI